MEFTLGCSFIQLKTTWIGSWRLFIFTFYFTAVLMLQFFCGIRTRSEIQSIHFGSVVLLVIKKWNSGGRVKWSTSNGKMVNFKCLPEWMFKINICWHKCSWDHCDYGWTDEQTNRRTDECVNRFTLSESTWKNRYCGKKYFCVWKIFYLVKEEKILFFCKSTCFEKVLFLS